MCRTLPGTSNSSKSPVSDKKRLLYIRVGDLFPFFRPFNLREVETEPCPIPFLILIPPMYNWIIYRQWVSPDYILSTHLWVTTRFLKCRDLNDPPYERLSLLVGRWDCGVLDLSHCTTYTPTSPIQSPTPGQWKKKNFVEITNTMGFFKLLITRFSDLREFVSTIKTSCK